tara:strand:- start:5923 stop:6330 length:408 start_codon:yes stop_codon:yes gene_type:complete
MQIASQALKNDQWIDDEEVADPDVLPTLKGFHVLVRPVSVKAKTKGGLIIPDSTRADIAYLTTVAKVLKVGELAYHDKAKFPNGKWCEAGDYVCYAKHSGTKMNYKGVKLILLYDDQVMMKIDDPTDLDPTYNLS